MGFTFQKPFIFIVSPRSLAYTKISWVLSAVTSEWLDSLLLDYTMPCPGIHCVKLAQLLTFWNCYYWQIYLFCCLLSRSRFMWVFHLMFLRVGFKNMLSPRLPVRIGCGRLRPCEKSNMFDISPDPNRLFFPAINKMSSPRLPQASSDQIYTVLCCPRPPATLSRRP